MPRYLLQHRHEPRQCGVVFAAFRGGMRVRCGTRRTLASCESGGHAIWWTVDAATGDEALGLLPGYVAARTTADPGERGGDPLIRPRAPRAGHPTERTRSMSPRRERDNGAPRGAIRAGPGAAPRRPMNVAARMARRSAAHWKTATFGWLAFVVAASPSGLQVRHPDRSTQRPPAPGESGHADSVLARAVQPAARTSMS